MSSIQLKHSHIRSGDATLALSEFGQGQPLVFVNGLGATQVTWKKIIRQLTGQYRVITFDFRGHGKASTSRHYHLDDFAADLETVLDSLKGERPILAGWSMGADLAVWYAAAHSDRVAGLFLIDGAVPVNLVISAEDVRRRLNTLSVRIGPLLLYLVGMGYRLSPDDLATLTIELNTRREQLLSAYDQLDCPVAMALATKSAGEKGARAERNNALWRAGGEKLTRTYPAISLQWLNNTHLLPFKESTRLARSLDEFVRRIQADNLRDAQRAWELGKRTH